MPISPVCWCEIPDAHPAEWIRSQETQANWFTFFSSARRLSWNLPMGWLAISMKSADLVMECHEENTNIRPLARVDAWVYQQHLCNYHKRVTSTSTIHVHKLCNNSGLHDFWWPHEGLQTLAELHQATPLQGFFPCKVQNELLQLVILPEAPWTPQCAEARKHVLFVLNLYAQYEAACRVIHAEKKYICPKKGRLSS